MPRQDDFPQSVKEALARRVAYRCSNPNCKHPTIGPSASDIGKAVNIGVAAHITAASPGGARYDHTMSSEERQSPANGIWCCQNCAKLIDNDLETFTIALLKRWKSIAEQQAFLDVSSRGLTPPETSNFSWSSHQQLFSSHCLRIVFSFTNDGTEPIREYAAKLYLPAPVAKYLRYHNPGDPIRDEVLSFNGPLLWDHAASYSVQSPFHGNLQTLTPRAKMQDHPLLPAGSSIPVAEIDFGFTCDTEAFLAEIMPHSIEAEFWAGTRKKLTLCLRKQSDNTVRYCEDTEPDSSKQSFDDRRIEKLVEDLETQLVAPGQERAVVKSSQRLTDAAAAIFLQRGWRPEQVRSWPVDYPDNHAGQYYLEVLAD